MPPLSGARIWCLALLLCAVTLGSVPERADALEVGMGNQWPTMFHDARFQELDLRHVRLAVAWDAIEQRGYELPWLDAWLGAARAQGREPLVAFQRADKRPGYLPTLEEYQRAFRAFRLRYPWVRTYTPWNEANHRSQPTSDHPRRAAGYYNIIRAECSDCAVLATDVLDDDGMMPWLETFRQYADGDPQLWGLHNHVETNRPDRPGSTEAFLNAVPGEVWVTETSGLVELSVDGRITWPHDEARAAEAVRRAFRIAESQPRVTRMYLYSWSARSIDVWDSALIRLDGRARPALAVLREELARLRGFPVRAPEATPAEHPRALRPCPAARPARPIGRPVICSRRAFRGGSGRKACRGAGTSRARAGRRARRRCAPAARARSRPRPSLRRQRAS